MKIGEKYVIEDIEWSDGNTELPTRIELPIYDTELSSKDCLYSGFMNQTQRATESYYDELYNSFGFYLQNKFNHEIDGFVGDREQFVELEESDVIHYFKKLPLDNRKGLFNILKVLVDEN
jgi:hypothetical protein